jgi:hypothetical protein
MTEKGIRYAARDTAALRYAFGEIKIPIPSHEVLSIQYLLEELYFVIRYSCAEICLRRDRNPNPVYTKCYLFNIYSKSYIL